MNIHEFQAKELLAKNGVAVPAFASSFILETVPAKAVLKEDVGTRHGAGALLVLGG